MTTPVAIPDKELLDRGRSQSVPKITPIRVNTPSILMLEPTGATLQACVQAAMSLRVRAVTATQSALEKTATNARPLVIVVESCGATDEERLADVAFAVGALIVRVGGDESAETVQQRLLAAIEASMRIRGQTQDPP